jgi:hypothetical protein
MLSIAMFRVMLSVQGTLCKTSIVHCNASTILCGNTQSLAYTLTLAHLLSATHFTMSHMCSLVSNTVGGTFASFDKVTGALGNTLAQLSLDPTYQRDRARQRLIAGETMKDSMAQV